MAGIKKPAIWAALFMAMIPVLAAAGPPAGMAARLDKIRAAGANLGVVLRQPKAAEKVKSTATAKNRVSRAAGKASRIAAKIGRKSEKILPRSRAAAALPASRAVKIASSAVESAQIEAAAAITHKAAAGERSAALQAGYTSLAELDQVGKDFPSNKEGLLLKPGLPEDAGHEIRYNADPQVDKPITLNKDLARRLSHPCAFKRPVIKGAGKPAPALKGPVSPLTGSIDKLSGRYWAGEVSAAMEAMRMLAGPLSPKEQEAFNRSWAPLFDYPSDEAKEWLSRLTPLVTEFLALSQEVESLLEVMEGLKYEAEMAAAYENEEICEDLILQMGEAGSVLKNRRGRLTELAGMINEMGWPPDPMNDKCAAQRRTRKLVKLKPPEKGEKKPEPKAKGPKYPLPDSFFKKLPPSMAAYFKDKGMWYWLKLDKKKADQPKLAVKNQLPFKVREDFHWHEEAFYGHGLTWSGRGFSSSMQDKGFAALKCKKGEDERKQKARYEIKGSLAKDGYTLKDLTGRITVHQCISRDLPGPDGEIGTPDDDYRLERQTITRTADFRDLPLAEADPIIIGAQRGVILYYRVKGAAATRKHLAGLSNKWPSAKPRESNYIELSLSLSQGGPKRAAAPKKPGAADIKQRKIAFHKNNIKWLKKDIAYLYKQLAQARDRGGITALNFQLTCKQADLQGEKDAVARINTGQWVRTPTAWDGMVRAQMAVNSRKMAEKIKKNESNRKRLDRMIEALPPGERGKMRNWARKHLSEKPFDEKTRKKVGRIVAQRLQAVNQAKAANAASQEAVAQLGVDIMENYQAAAQYAMYAAPFVAGGGVLAITYGITSGGVVGYQTGGIKGAAVGATTTALRYWSPKIDYALTFYEGYQTGGIKGAVKHTAITFIKRKAVQKVTQGIQRYQHKRQVAVKQAKLKAWREAQRSVRFKQERAYGKAMVKRLSEYQAKYNAARKSGASRKSLRLLEKKIMDQTAAIKNAPHAKGYLKFNATGKEKAAYGTWDKRHTNRIVRELKQDLARQGFDVSELRFKPIRNSGNTSPGMDLDLAMNSTSGNTVRWKDPKTGRTKTLDLYTANAMVQDRFNTVYKRNSGGRAAGGAWQNVTTSKHLEAYPDTNWLKVSSMQKKGIDPRANLDPNYAEDAGRVTLFKAHEMRRHGGAFTDNQNWEIYRGTSKDIKSKVMPLLTQRIQNAKTPKIKAQLEKKLGFYKDLSKAMDKANHDPVAAGREVKKLTGFDTVDTVDMVSSAIESLGKW